MRVGELLSRKIHLRNHWHTDFKRFSRSVRCTLWKEVFRRLTSACEYGLTEPIEDRFDSAVEAYGRALG